MILTLSIVTGFKNEVRDKVIGYGAHVQVMSAGGSSIIDSDPFLLDTVLIHDLKQIKYVAKVSPVAYKPGVFQSQIDSVFYILPSGKDTFQIQQDIKGVLFKGIDAEYDKTFFETNLIEGRLPVLDKEPVNELLISKRVANQLRFTLNQQISAFFVHNKPIKRNFVIVGIFETGLDDFDKDVVIADLRTIQEHSGWGIKASIRLQDTLYQNRLLFEAQATGGQGQYKYDWGNGFGLSPMLATAPIRDTTIRLIVSDYSYSPYDDTESSTLADTAYMHIHVKGDILSGPIQMDNAKIVRHYLDDDGFHFDVNVGDGSYTFEQQDGKGSHHHYISGYEILASNWDDLHLLNDEVKNDLFIASLEKGTPISVRTIKEIYSDIFAWLSFLDINFMIIIIMMIAISIITMGATLLVLILEKTSTIGLLKAIGASNWMIRKIFLYQAAYLIGRGMIWGNFIGIGLALAQYYFQLIPLDASVYYLNAVPIELNLTHLLLLNLGTILICIITLVIPSYFITKISPVKALKFS
jgi:lipoprotein-releasing system permease protein